MPERRWDPAAFERIEKDGKTYLTAREEVCDFCLASDPTWEYPATDMPVKGHPLIDESTGEWAACDECHALIEAKKLGALVERCAQAQLGAETPADVHAPPLPILRRQLRENMLRFFDARTGPARPFTP